MGKNIKIHETENKKNFKKMVQLSNKLLTSRKKQLWIDSLRIYCKAGSGGNGTPNYGGLGGPGGSVTIKVASEEKVRKKKKSEPTNLTELFKHTFKSDPLKQRVEASHGKHSSKNRLNGEKGEDKELIVPRGVSVVDDRGNLLYDLNTFGQEYKAAIGGAGGSEVTNFIGLPGQKRHIRLDLKLLADIGLVGFPNAGKSTLLNAISNARPKIASYPFTTIKPNLGHLSYPDLRVITMADLPGLIEGSHKNLGMGHRFLKHVERTKLLFFIIDVNGFRLGPEYPFRTAYENLVLLTKELELYNPDLLKKSCVLAVNKMDTENAKEKLEEFESCLQSNMEKGIENIPEGMLPNQQIEFKDILLMSAKEDAKSVQNVKEKLRIHIDDIYQADEQEKIKELTTEIDALLIQSDNNKFML